MGFKGSPARPHQNSVVEKVKSPIHLNDACYILIILGVEFFDANPEALIEEEKIWHSGLNATILAYPR
jgi:hypothetical protein